MARVGQERATGIELYDRGNSRVEERKEIMPRRWTARSTGGTAAEPSCNSADSTAASVCYTPSLRRKQLPTIEQRKTQLKKRRKKHRCQRPIFHLIFFNKKKNYFEIILLKGKSLYTILFHKWIKYTIVYFLDHKGRITG